MNEATADTVFWICFNIPFGLGMGFVALLFVAGLFGVDLTEIIRCKTSKDQDESN